MKNTNTANRLKEIMSERNLRQVDILNMTKPYCERYGVKMNKSDISQYCSGKVEPNQDKLFILSAALNVDASWLMGYDVSSEPEKFASVKRDYCIYKAVSEGFRSFGWEIDLEQIDDSKIQYIISNNTCSITVGEEVVSSIENRLKRFLIKELKDIFVKQNNELFDNMAQFPVVNDNNHLEVLAAHERTDIKVTDEMRKHDKDIMMDDSEWE